MSTRGLRLVPLLLLALLLAVPAMGQELEATGGEFADPILLMAGEEPMGGKLIYPSPAMFDLDGDGALELYVGDLWGRVWTAERAPGDDPVAWTELVTLKLVDGQQLEFNNW